MMLGLSTRIADMTSADGMVEFDQLEDGNYFARFRSISPNGFEGLPQTYAFKRRLNSVSGSAGKGDVGYAFKWLGEGQGNDPLPFPAASRQHPIASHCR